MVVEGRRLRSRDKGPLLGEAGLSCLFSGCGQPHESGESPEVLDRGSAQSLPIGRYTKRQALLGHASMSECASCFLTCSSPVL